MSIKKTVSTSKPIANPLCLLISKQQTNSSLLSTISIPSTPQTILLRKAAQQQFNASLSANIQSTTNRLYPLISRQLINSLLLIPASNSSAISIQSTPLTTLSTKIAINHLYLLILKQPTNSSLLIPASNSLAISILNTLPTILLTKTAISYLYLFISREPTNFSLLIPALNSLVIFILSTFLITLLAKNYILTDYISFICY